MYRLLTVIAALLLMVTDYVRLGFILSMVAVLAYIMLILVFHQLAENADRKKRKRKRAHRTGTSVSSMQQIK